jgi:hypothetical protein
MIVKSNVVSVSDLQTHQNVTCLCDFYKHKLMLYVYMIYQVKLFFNIDS